MPGLKADQYLNVHFTGDIDPKISKGAVRLTDSLWTKIFGSGNPGADVPIAELPLGYMLLKKIRLSLNSDFLRYCCITDTPGFGSVTEEHDRITERYIRDEAGSLFVMVRVDPKTDDSKFRALITNIANIYDSSNKQLHKKDVVFILNLFGNLFTENQKSEAVKGAKDIVVKEGFSKSKIYVCDLIRVLQYSEFSDVMYGMPSYKRFQQFCLNELIAKDLEHRQQSILSDWGRYIRSKKECVKHWLYDEKKEQQDIQKEKEKWENSRNGLLSMSYDNSEYKAIIKEITDCFEDFWKEISVTIDEASKGKRKEQLQEKLDDFVCTLDALEIDIKERIFDHFQSLDTELIELADFKVGDLWKDDDYTTEKSLLAIANVTFSNLIEGAAENIPKRPDFSKKKKEAIARYQILFQEQIQSDRDSAIENVNGHWDDCYRGFSQRKNETKRFIENNISDLKDPKSFEQKIQTLYALLRDLNDMDNRLGQIK